MHASRPILAAIGLALLLHTVAAATVLETWTDLIATYYYDNGHKHSACNAHHGGGKWSDYVLDGTSACGKSIRAMRTNAIVAMNVTWLNQRGITARTEDLCGRELQLFRDGKQITIPGSPFFLWEGCQACATLPRVDLSVQAYIAASGDKECFQGTVPGIEVRLMDNFVHRGSLSSATRMGVSAVLVVVVVLVCIGL